MKIVTYPNPILRTRATPVEKVTEELVSTAQKMLSLMYESNGIGLSAQQVGLTDRIIVMDTTQVDPVNGFKGMLFNPEILHLSGQVIPFSEGCLSFPGIEQTVCRKSIVLVKYINAQNQPTTQIMTGISAICALHEIDHLNGILMIDYKESK
jgi:peptide deformylase